MSAPLSNPAGRIALDAGALLPRGIDHLLHLQDRQYGHDRWAVLLVDRALGTAGHEGTVQHVMYGVPPRACHVRALDERIGHGA